MKLARVITKVNGVAPSFNSGAVVGALIVNASSSVRIVPVVELAPPPRPPGTAMPVEPVLPVLGVELALDKVTANVSLGSTDVSPLTLTVMVWVDGELAAKVIGMGVLKVFAAKSDAAAALPPVP